MRVPSELVPQPALPGQLTLFAMRRDWSVLTGVDRRRQDLPELTPAARALVVDFDWLMRRQEWHPHTRHLYRRTLMILVSWLGADAPLLESDIYDLERSDPNVAARRLCRFLADRGLLVPDPRRHQDRDQIRVEAAIAAWPPPLSSELQAWVGVLRRPAHQSPWACREPLGYRIICGYLRHLHPVLAQWRTEGITSLTQVTATHVGQALAGRRGVPRYMLLAALRSLFKALRH
ncbi:hypothetical protein ABZ063_45130, partial [Streptomyces sp. NPDC006333]